MARGHPNARTAPAATSGASDSTSPATAPDAAPATSLTIVRHGQTSANVDGVWHGSINTPLTEHGHAQAAAVAARLETSAPRIAHVYASPLERAHHTALAIARPHGLQPRVEADLAEYDLGRWEGLSFATLFREKRLFEHMRRDPDYRPHGGESPRQVGDRLAGALGRIAERHVGERVVVVTHGGALSIAFGVLLDDDYTRWDRMMSNCALSELRFHPDASAQRTRLKRLRAELLEFNLTDHLPVDPNTSER